MKDIESAAMLYALSIKGGYYITFTTPPAERIPSLRLCQFGQSIGLTDLGNHHIFVGIYPRSTLVHHRLGGHCAFYGVHNDIPCLDTAL